MFKFFKKKRFYAEEFGIAMRGEKKEGAAAAGKNQKDAKKNSAAGGAAGGKKLTQYGRQLKEKQRVRFTYGLSERQLSTLFRRISSLTGARGENFLIALERRLDNVVYRLKLAASRKQSRQLVVHGHVYVNGIRVSSPSFAVSIGDKVSIGERSLAKEAFVKFAVDKRLSRGIKVPEWLALNKEEKSGEVLRMPLRSEIGTPVEERYIVELYSK